MVGVQMIERPWGVAAYGAASVRALPDLVRVRCKVMRLEQTPSAAFDAASQGAHAVRQALREHGVPDAGVEGSRPCCVVFSISSVSNHPNLTCPVRGRCGAITPAEPLAKLWPAAPRRGRYLTTGSDR